MPLLSLLEIGRLTSGIGKPCSSVSPRSLAASLLSSSPKRLSSKSLSFAPYGERAVFGVLGAMWIVFRPEVIAIGPPARLRGMSSAALSVLFAFAPLLRGLGLFEDLSRREDMQKSV